MLEKRVLPKVGDKIPINQFFISKTNMRFDEPFPVDEEDQTLIEHFRAGAELVELIKARPEDEKGHWEPGMDLDLAVGYGVAVARRRFLGMKESGRYKELTVGEHVLIREMTDEQAMDMSLKENWEEFRKTPDPITRAKAINKYLSRLPTGLRGLARAWGMKSHSTLSEYLKILELNEPMQRLVQKRLVSFRDGLATARLRLGDERQTKLAETAESQGVDAFKLELASLMAGKGKRGIPAGLYELSRVMWDKRDREDMSCYKIVTKAAEKKGMKTPEYIKDYIKRHIDEIKRERAA